MRKLAAVTVNYCCANEIIANLRVISDQVTKAGGRWYIVDNFSPDDSVSVMRSALTEVENVELIEAPRNGGFGYGNNRVIERVISREIDAQYVFLLNPDALPEGDAIEQMVRYLDENASVGVVGSALVNLDQTATESMFRFPSLFSEIELALSIGPVSSLLTRYRVSLPQMSQAGRVDWISGASFMIRADVLRKAGSFDEDFFLYWEEAELCYRVDRAGYEIHGLPSATVMHIGGLTTGLSGQARMPAYWHESRNLFFEKTRLAGPLIILNIVTTICLALGRAWHWLRGRPCQPPNFLRDHLRQAFFNR